MLTCTCIQRLLINKYETRKVLADIMLINLNVNQAYATPIESLIWVWARGGK